MKKNTLKRLSLLLTVTALFAVMLAGCGQQSTYADTPLTTTPSLTPPSSSDIKAPSASAEHSDDENSEVSLEESISATQLYVTFGDEGSSFTMNLYDNETAAAIAKHVGTADWRLPIYNYDGYENSDVMQYYDIPSRYEIPSNPESVTSEVSGAVYYSEPNRIVLFFGEASVSGEYTPVGYFDATDEFVSAVQNNPVIEGWGNKIIQISADVITT